MTPEQLKGLLISKRKELGYSHQDVADMCGANITRSFYGLIENGNRRPSIEVAKKIAKLLDIEWTVFFEVESNEKLRKRVAI
ncbi:helix-turn-helix transcriptional regulator [Planococcus dechangensis]|uniref:Helix-turn-helix transcriptional regulator n=1 Tax=Planococcus dechangensis TaxID=1176255 RepID=A0ABV9MA73_9BACL